MGKIMEKPSSRRICARCGRPMARSTVGDICKMCVEEDLYHEVKDYISKNNATEIEVAQHFNIPLAQVRTWVHDGFIQYRKSQGF